MLMKFIYIFTSIINIIGPIACAANAVQAHKRHNTYARNGWIVAAVIWAQLFFAEFTIGFCLL